MVTYRITYRRNECIGAGACAAANPDLFEMDTENKAVLIGATEISEGIFQVDVEGDQKVIDAARACPVEVIKVVNLDTEEELV